MTLSRTSLLSLLYLLSISRAEEEKDQCGLYLAVSSTATADRTVWGIYAGKDIGKGETIASPDLAVNTLNLRANNLLDSSEEEDLQALLLKPLEFLEESFWVGDATGGKFELQEGRIIGAISGPGFLGAYESSMTNAEWFHKQVYQRTRMGEETGVAHPSRGAISPFYDTTCMSTEEIPAGAEIFINYGSSWEEEDAKDDLKKTDYARIDETVDQMIEFFAKHKDELDEQSKKEIYKFITKDVMNAAVGPEKARKVAKILPSTPEELFKIKAAGGSLQFSQPNAHRSLDWLREYGLCMDNIRVGPSTIPNAGRGAFATRRIKAGGLVAPTPLLHIPTSEVLDMHELYFTEHGDWARSSDEVTGQQLLVNYCYGHPSSSMLFYPTGSAVGFINHADKPNAKLVWSSHPGNMKQWFELEPEDLAEKENTYFGLMMEVVATRDIEEGEEIFLDYGPEWKAAWEEHVSEWEKLIASGEIGPEWPKRAVDFNEIHRTVPYHTEEEGKEAPYPKNVALVAFLMLAETDASGTLEDPKRWQQPEKGSIYNAENLFDATIVDRIQIEDDSLIMPYNYTVRWLNNKGEPTYVKGVPHEAFAYVDEPETGDQFFEHGFRHYIGIPDDIFPQGPWRDL